MAGTFLVPKSQFFDSNGDPLEGGFVYTYVAGDVALKTTYTDSALTTQQENPLVLNSRGEPDNPIWFSGSIKIVVKDSDNVTLYTFDNMRGVGISGRGTHYISDYGDSLTTAITSIGSGEADLIIDTEVTLTQADTVPSNINLVFTRAGSLTGAFTVTINGGLEAGLWQIFDSSITVEGNIKTEEHPVEWWGATADGSTASATKNGASIIAAVTYLIQTADGGILKFGSGEYYWGGDRCQPNNIVFLGDGIDITRLTMYDDGELTSIPTTSKFNTSAVGGNVTFEGITFNNDAFPFANDARIFWFIDMDNITVRSCKFVCRNHAFDIEGGDNHKVIDCVFVNSSSYVGAPSFSIGAGATTVASNVLVRGNYLEASTGLTADGNVINSINLHGCTEVIVTDNLVYGGYTCGILVENETSDNVIIANNYIDLVDNIATTTSMSGIKLMRTGRVKVQGNIILGNNNTVNNIGVQIQTLYTDDTDYKMKVITDNYIDGWHDGVNAGDGVTYTRLASFDISGNVFNNINDDGIVLNCSNLVAARDYNINVEGNKFYASPSMRFNTPTGTGNINIVNNHLGRNSESIRVLVTNPTIVVGGNTSLQGSQSLYTTGWHSLSASSYANIEWLDKKVWVSDEIDLSGAATYEYCLDDGLDRFITKLEFIYIEASSIDAGIDIVVAYWGTGSGGTIHTETTEVSKAIGYTKTYYNPDLHANSYNVYGVRPYYRIYSPGGKTGTGIIRVRIEYVENFGALL